MNWFIYDMNNLDPGILSHQYSQNTSYLFADGKYGVREQIMTNIFIKLSFVLKFTCLLSLCPVSSIQIAT